MCAFSGLGGTNDVSRVLVGQWNKMFVKHCFRDTRSSIEMLMVKWSKEVWEPLALSKLGFLFNVAVSLCISLFVQRKP